MSNPTRASVRQMARPIRLPPPVTSAAPRPAGCVSVNPTELDDVDHAQNRDETENDEKGQHEVLLKLGGALTARTLIIKRRRPQTGAPHRFRC